MKLLPLYVCSYIALLILDTAQLSGLYERVVVDTMLPPWLSLFVLNVMVLILSFKRAKWGEANPAKIFAWIIFGLHLLFFISGIEPEMFSLKWWEFTAASVAFSSLIAFSIFFLADQLASEYEAYVKRIEEKSRLREEIRKEVEEELKEREEAARVGEGARKYFENISEQMGKPIKYGNGFVRVVLDGGKLKVEKQTNEL